MTRISRRLLTAVCVIAAATVVSTAPEAVAAPDATLRIAFVPKLQVPYSDAPNSDRDAFVSQATVTAVGNATAEALMQAMGGKGKWAIVSCGETAENLNSWIAVEKDYVAQKYPADGSSSAGILWNVQNLGYLTGWAGQKLSTGTPLATTNDVNADLPAVEWDQATKTLVLGEPLLITTANVDQFNY